MNLRSDLDDGVTVVPMELDSLDAENAEEFRDALAELLEPTSLVLLDLDGLGFIDSSGLGAILTTLRELQQSGGDLKLCNVSVGVRSILELVRIDRLLDIFDDRESALSSF